MSGAISLKGLIYQQRYVLYRVLSALSDEMTTGSGDSRVISEFSIEGTTSGDGPAWDVWVRHRDDRWDFDECKDTAIDRPDRLTFYTRIRKQLAAGTPATAITPVWVTDPDKQTPNALAYIEGIPVALEAADLEGLDPALPVSVTSVDKAIQEAVYQLCHDPKPDGDSRRCTFKEARQLLGRLRVDRYRFADFDTRIDLLSQGLLDRGIAVAIREFVTGTLTERIVNTGQARFSPDELLEAVGTTRVALEVESRIRDLMTDCAASGQPRSARTIRWNSLPGKPFTTWPLKERIPDYDPDHSCLIIASMGVGKTVASQQAFEMESRRRDPRRVLRVEARVLDQEALSALQRLICLLAGVAPTWLVIDGLDEVPSGLAGSWEQAISTFACLPNVAFLATVRSEVLAARPWLKDCTEGLKRLTMGPVELSAVEKAFKDVGLPVPENKRLIAVLQNPLLLSLYADIVTPEDMPLAESGEVTAFRVVAEFWDRRVSGISHGLRAVGDAESSKHAKALAAAYLADRSLAGDLNISIESVSERIATGVQTLLSEGVIRQQGSTSVVWLHDWIREYAMVRRILDGLDSDAAAPLAGAVASCEDDSAARSAAAGGVKWILSRGGGAEAVRYLSELWSRNKGLAREALAVVIEGAGLTIKLADLPEELLLEAVTLATELGALQWKGQVASLPSEPFFGGVGDELHARVVRYELELASEEACPPSEAILRLIARDLERLERGYGSTRGTVHSLLRVAGRQRLFHEEVVVNWLVRLGSLAQHYDLSGLCKTVKEMIEQGQVANAGRVFRSVLADASSSRGRSIAGLIATGRGLVAKEVVEVLELSNLLGRHPGDWAVTSLTLFARVVAAQQEDGWPERRGW